jgi:hypothetical protein
MEKIEIKKHYTYDFFKKLFDDGFGEYCTTWKCYYFKEAQRVFKKHFELLGMWGINPNDENKYGIIRNYKWAPENRINTHPNCCKYLCELALSTNPNIFTDLGNPKYHSENVKKLWNFIDKNFDTIFTSKNTDKYYSKIRILLSKSWNSGNSTSIALRYVLKNIFPNANNIDFTFDYGDGEDMDGCDMSFEIDGARKTIQIKSGKFNDMKDEVLVSGSPNDLKYKTDYYVYVHIDDYRCFTSIILFKNSNKLTKDKDKIIKIPSDLVIYKKLEHMEIPEKLVELLNISTKKDFEFSYTKEGYKNYIDINKSDKTVIVNISDYEDKNFINEIQKNIDDLKKFSH